MATKAELKEAIREVLAEKAVTNDLAEKLFSADVIEAPDGEDKVKNPTWQMRSFLNRLVNNTKKDTPPA